MLLAQPQREALMGLKGAAGGTELGTLGAGRAGGPRGTDLTSLSRTGFSG